MKLSFVILSYRRPELLRRCLESLGRCGMGREAEAWIGFNGDDPSHDAPLRELPARFPWARFVRLERTSRGEARNRLAARAGGEILFFLDDDATVPRGFVARVLEKFERYPRAPAVGGPNVGPPGASAVERGQEYFFRSAIGAGPLSIRFSPRGADRPLPGWCFQLSNLGFRRDVFAAHGLRFPGDCWSAEENLLLFRVERALGPAMYCPELFVYHRRRATPAAFCRQMFLSGAGRMQITRRAPGSLHPIALLPPAGLAYLACLPLATRSAAALAPAAAYAAGLAASAFAAAVRERDVPGALWSAPITALGHLSYAAGCLCGLWAPGPRADPARPWSETLAGGATT